MPRLAAFGDEIAADIRTQVEVMASERVRALELRGAEGQAVLDLKGGIREEVRSRLRDAGMEVFSIGSPIGKVPVESDPEAEVERLKLAVEQAIFFGAPRVRVFSFFIPDRRYGEHRAEVMDRMARLASVAADAGVVLCHENEARIYGETVGNCVDLLRTVNSPALRAVHDTANFVVAGEEPFPAGYEAVKPWLEYFHVKDFGGGKVQPAGEGDGRFPDLLARLKEDAYDGYLSLEPHLGGGPDAFRSAVRALRRCLEEVGYIPG